MMRELSLQLSQAENRRVDRRFFALATTEGEHGIRVSPGASAEEVEPIAALDAEITQSEQYLASE